MLLTSIPRPNSTLIDTRPKLYVLEPLRKVAFQDSEFEMQNMSNDDEYNDNPFRPGSELSREADIIVNLIKEGKPITPTREMPENGPLSGVNNNNNLTNSNGHSTKISEQARKNGNTPGGIIEVKHSIVQTKTAAPGGGEPPNHNVEMVVINRKKKRCCEIL